MDGVAGHHHRIADRQLYTAAVAIVDDHRLDACPLYLRHWAPSPEHFGHHRIQIVHVREGVVCEATIVRLLLGRLNLGVQFRLNVRIYGQLEEQEACAAGYRMERVEQE